MPLREARALSERGRAWQRSLRIPSRPRGHWGGLPSDRPCRVSVALAWECESPTLHLVPCGGWQGRHGRGPCLGPRSPSPVGAEAQCSRKGHVFANTASSGQMVQTTQGGTVCKCFLSLSWCCRVHINKDKELHGGALQQEPVRPRQGCRAAPAPWRQELLTQTTSPGCAQLWTLPLRAPNHWEVHLSGPTILSCWGEHADLSYFPLCFAY